jgi:hypothetical protein
MMNADGSGLIQLTSNVTRETYPGVLARRHEAGVLQPPGG